MGSATGWLWDRLNRPIDDVQVLRVLLGLDEVSARHLQARLLLESDQARELLEATAPLIRLLRNTQGTIVRTEPSIRGPVLWAATISHRAASGFQDDLYVCATAVRHYDVPENRALAAALRELHRAGRSVAAAPGSPPDGAQAVLLGRARRAGHLAAHPRLRGVPARRPSARELARIRSGVARRSYEPAVAVLERVAAGPGLAEVAPFVDRRHQAQHRLLELVASELERRGPALDPFRTWRGQLFSGHLRYLPPRERGAGLAAGVVVDDAVFALPEPGDPPERDRLQAVLERRFHPRSVVAVTRPDDVRRSMSDRTGATASLV